MLYNKLVCPIVLWTASYKEVLSAYILEPTARLSSFLIRNSSSRQITTVLAITAYHSFFPSWMYLSTPHSATVPELTLPCQPANLFRQHWYVHFFLSLLCQTHAFICVFVWMFFKRSAEIMLTTWLIVEYFSGIHSFWPVKYWKLSVNTNAEMFCYQFQRNLPFGNLMFKSWYTRRINKTTVEAKQ